MRHTPRTDRPDPDTIAANQDPPCYPDANGYNTGYDPATNALTHQEVWSAVNYYEWCADHNKPLEVAPFGDVASGGPATLPDPNIVTNGNWFSGSPYLGPDATVRATGTEQHVSAGEYSSQSCHGAWFCIYVVLTQRARDHHQ